MASRKKRFRLTEIDLARAATAPDNRKKSIIKQATGGSGYDRYRGVKSNLGAILNISLPLMPTSRPSKGEIRAAIERDSYDGRGEKAGNKAVGEGFYDFVTAHKVTAAEFNFEPVALGPAGKRVFWARYILKIDGKKRIPFFDFRGETRLTPEAMRFVFSGQSYSYPPSKPERIWGHWICDFSIRTDERWGP